MQGAGVDGGPGPAGGAAARDDAHLDARLRQIVPLFASLAKSPNRAELQSELQRYIGGAANLPDKYQRTRPAGHEHLIVNNPTKAVLLAAWRAFVEPDAQGACAFDARSVYTPDEMVVRTGRMVAAAPGPRAAPARVDARSIQCGSGVVLLDAWVDQAMAQRVGLKLERWRRVNAPDVRARAQEVRAQQREEDASAVGCERDDFRADVRALLDGAVACLFVRRNCCELFHCMPAQVVDALPGDMDHFGLLVSDAACAADCDKACRQHAEALAAEVLHSRRVRIATRPLGLGALCVC